MNRVIRFFTILLFTCASALAPRPASAQGSQLTYTVPETGQGSFSLSGGPATPMFASLLPDSGPGGSPSALTYVLPLAGTIVPGDLFLLDAGSSTSDVIRFNPPATFPPSLVFYSLSPGTDPADTGFPTLSYPNNLSLTEDGSGITTYTPTSIQPGFISGFAVTYLISSPAAVPEPATVLLLTIGGAAALLRLRRKA